jgi:hypothetical protein
MLRYICCSLLRPVIQHINTSELRNYKKETMIANHLANNQQQQVNNSKQQVITNR